MRAEKNSVSARNHPTGILQTRRLAAAVTLGLTIGLAAVAVHAEPTDQPWEGDITEKDLRRKDLIGLIQKKQIPQMLKLRYSRTESDFLVFYDIEGKDIYFRYREDRFDSEAEKRIAHLASGEAYEVTGPFAGAMLYSILYSDENPRFSEILQNPNSLPVFVFKSARPLRIDQILL